MSTMTRKNLFATVLTYAAPSSNYRGESEENRTIIQKVTKGDHEYAVISPESMRNALREILALRDAARVVGHWRLSDCTLYVTLEPCVMCAGALVNSRIGRVVYGATDPKAGAVTSLYEVCADERLNHRPPVAAGVLADECGRLLKDFFAARRG